MRASRASSRQPMRRRFRGQSHEERLRERRQRLLDAGLATFGSRGFHSIGVREICSEARLTERYFYESFANREALFLAVYERCIDRIREAIQAALKDASPVAASMARAGLRAFLTCLRDDPRLARIVLLDVLTISPDVGEQSRLVMQSFADLIGNIAGGLHPDLAEHHLDARLIANGLIGATVFLAMQWAFGGFREDIEDVLEHGVLF